MDKKILVIGATGPLGQPVGQTLKEAGFAVRVMTRDLQKGRKLFDSKLFDNSFEIFAGDPMDLHCLEGAMDGCSGVHISLPGAAELAVAERVAKMALRHGIERISYISGATVAEENRWFAMVDRKFLAEKAIRESGIPYSIFCPTWVMESLPLFVNQGRASVLGKQPCPYHWVAAEDIARMVATAYRLGDEATGRFIVHGPEAIRMDEALKRYCAAFHPEIKSVSSMPFWMVGLMAALMRNPDLKSAGEMMAYFEKVGEWKNLPQANCVLDAPATTLAAWLRK